MTTTTHETAHGSWTPENTFAERLALIRVHHGWNVLQAAEACGLPRATWKSWERGSKPQDYLAVCQRIAGAAGVDEDWLLTGRSTGRYPWPVSSLPLALVA